LVLGGQSAHACVRSDHLLFDRKKGAKPAQKRTCGATRRLARRPPPLCWSGTAGGTSGGGCCCCCRWSGWWWSWCPFVSTWRPRRERARARESAAVGLPHASNTQNDRSAAVVRRVGRLFIKGGGGGLVAGGWLAAARRKKKESGRGAFPFCAGGRACAAALECFSRRRLFFSSVGDVCVCVCVWSGGNHDENQGRKKKEGGHRASQAPARWCVHEVCMEHRGVDLWGQHI
jgi:hypothetical protein